MAQHLLQSDPNEMEGQGANEIYETLIAQQVMIEQLQRTQKWSNSVFIAILMAFIAICYSNILEGPQGPRGPQGPQGLQGLQGAQGLQGLNGTDGKALAQTFITQMHQKTDLLQTNVDKLMPFIIRDKTFNVKGWWEYD
eukprot:381339_1